MKIEKAGDRYVPSVSRSDEISKCYHLDITVSKCINIVSNECWSNSLLYPQYNSLYYNSD